MKSQMAYLLLFIIPIVALATVPSTPSPAEKDSYEGKRLIKINETHPAVLMTKEEIQVLVKNNIGFLDITHEKDFDTKVDKQAKGRSFRKFTAGNPQHQKIVQKALKLVNQSRLEGFAQNMTKFFNRVFDTESAGKAQQWLVNEAKKSLKKLEQSVNTTIETHPASLFAQENVIARIRGCHKTMRDEVIVVGAHQDNILSAPEDTRTFGADDNASGSSVIMEVLRAISEFGMRFKRTVEFHWYAMEEEGRVGSLTLSEEYQRKKINVKAMLNLDVVGYKAEGSNDTVGIYTGFTDAALNDFIRLLVNEYLNYNWEMRACGYACSDHATWFLRGYPSAFVSEPRFTPYMHSLNDTIPNINFEQMMEFVKLATAYVIELAEPYDNKERPEFCE